MKNRLLPFLIIVMPACSFAQDKPRESKVKFGFSAGVSYSNLQISTVNFVYAKDVQVKNGVGGRMGLGMDCELSEHMTFSFQPGMAFNSSKVSMTKLADQKEVYSVLPTTIETAMLFSYKLKPQSPAPYLLFGPCIKFPLNDPKNSMSQISRTSDLSIDFGVGMDKMFPNFHFAPELRYSYGLMNLSGVNEISRLNMHSISLIFNFKG